MPAVRSWIASGLVLAGCAAFSTGCAATSAQPGPGTSPSASPSTTVAGNPLVLDEHAKGKTITVTVGTSVKLILHSSYWNIKNSSSPKVLAETGGPTQLPVAPTCPPGVGCNPVQATFTAMTAGTAVLSASRISCGEAMLCAPAQRHFQVTVIVMK
jgi:hypothetical protein